MRSRVKPNDAHAELPFPRDPFRVLLIAGLEPAPYNCPGVDSKARTLMLRMAERLPQEWEIDLEDLGNVYGREHIQSCNACVSTSMALCVLAVQLLREGQQGRARPDVGPRPVRAARSRRRVGDHRAGELVRADAATSS